MDALNSSNSNSNNCIRFDVHNDCHRTNDFFTSRTLRWTGEYRDDAEAWYEVMSESGAELLQRPDTEGGRMLELFLRGKVRVYVCCIIPRTPSVRPGSSSF